MAKLLFLQNQRTEFFGPMYISAMLKANGHDCRLAIGETLDDFHKDIREYRPDLIGFSIMTGNQEWARSMAVQVKKEYGLPNIFGGPHPTFFPEFALEEGVDALVRGEGEQVMLDVMERVARGKAFSDISNIAHNADGVLSEVPVRPLPDDIDVYPMPDRTLYSMLRGTGDDGVQRVITARGCPYLCTFCFQDSMRRLYRGKGRAMRVRSIDEVIKECRDVKENHDARVIYFADDAFGLDRKWMYAFLPRYKKEVGLPFICLIRANVVAQDEGYAQALADAGCQSVFFGIETGNEYLRNEVLKKNLTNAHIRTAAERIHAAGLKFRAYNILGLPGETLDDAFATVALNIEVKADYPWCSIFSPYPGTQLAAYAEEHGYLSPDFDYSTLSGSFFVESRLNLPHARELGNLQKFFQTAVLMPWTLPFIKRLIKLPPNPLYSLWFGFIYFIVFIRSEQRNFLSTLKYALANAKHVLR